MPSNWRSSSYLLRIPLWLFVSHQGVHCSCSGYGEVSFLDSPVPSFFYLGSHFNEVSIRIPALSYSLPALFYLPTSWARNVGRLNIQVHHYLSSLLSSTSGSGSLLFSALPCCGMCSICWTLLAWLLSPLSLSSFFSCTFMFEYVARMSWPLEEAPSLFLLLSYCLLDLFREPWHWQLLSSEFLHVPVPISLGRSGPIGCFQHWKSHPLYSWTPAT